MLVIGSDVTSVMHCVQQCLLIRASGRDCIDAPSSDNHSWLAACCRSAVLAACCMALLYYFIVRFFIVQATFRILHGFCRSCICRACAELTVTDPARRN